MSRVFIALLALAFSAGSIQDKPSPLQGVLSGDLASEHFSGTWTTKRKIN